MATSDGTNIWNNMALHSSTRGAIHGLSDVDSPPCRIGMTIEDENVATTANIQRLTNDWNRFALGCTYPHANNDSKRVW